MKRARRFRRIESADDNLELASLYAEIIESGLGDRVPLNWFTAQAERPDILAATWALSKGILLHGHLPPTVKQMIAVKVARYNQCHYCAAVHSSALEAMGVRRWGFPPRSRTA
jgi:AhpD family alkylhydroperoxidase